MSDKHKRHMNVVSTAFILLFGLSIIACLTACDGCDIGNGGWGTVDTKTACCSEGTPTGYYKINSSLDMTKCGGTPGTTTHNLCTYQRYDNKPIGTVMTICSDNILAAGWQQTGTSWDPTKCGNPPTNTNNVLTVKRVN
jgi:hypothetical protein